MTAPAGQADPPAGTIPAVAVTETKPASSLEATMRRAAGEVARRLPPMTAEQAALVRHLLRDQHH